MIVCGVDIKSNEAFLALVKSSAEGLEHLKSGTKKIALGDDRESQSLIAMKAAIEAFAQQHHVELFVVKTRLGKGKMASSGVTFKIEAVFQLSSTPVSFVSAQSIAKLAKTNSGAIPASLLGYQEDAYRAAAVHLSKL